MKKLWDLLKHNLHTALYILVFVLLVPVLGVTSIWEYLDFKLNDRLDYNEWNAELGSKLETDIASSFHQKFEFVNLNGAMRNVLGQQEMNNITKLNNGKLAELFVHPPDEADLRKRADKTVQLRDFLESQGTELLFVMMPYCISPYDPQLPAGVYDYSNAMDDIFLEYVRQDAVDTIDLREEMHNDGIDQYDMMYRTDHHWNTHAGIYSYGKIEDWLVEKTGCKVDPRIRDRSQYDIEVYPGHHLGMYGQRTGKYFGGIDDFELYVPKFNALIQREGSDQAGNLQSVFFHKEALEAKDVTSRYTYDFVLGEDTFTKSRYVSHSSENDLKILVISDSFFKSLAQYMIMGYRDVTYIHTGETAYYTTAGHLWETQYDAVILLYEPSMLVSPNSFNFLSDMEM